MIKVVRKIKMPVHDIFKDEEDRIAPISAQPRLSQREFYQLTKSPEEMSRTDLFGTLLFMNKSYYDFRILSPKRGLSPADRKAKFMKICERTWDEYILRLEL